MIGEQSTIMYLAFFDSGDARDFTIHQTRKEAQAKLIETAHKQGIPCDSFDELMEAYEKQDLETSFTWYASVITVEIPNSQNDSSGNFGNPVPQSRRDQRPSRFGRKRKKDTTFRLVSFDQKGVNLSQGMGTRMKNLTGELAALHNKLLAVDSLEEAQRLQRAASILMDEATRLRNALGFRVLDLKRQSTVSIETNTAFTPSTEENRRVIAAVLGAERTAALTDDQVLKVVNAIIRDSEMRRIFETLGKAPGDIREPFLAIVPVHEEHTQ
jgi:hypothetical protein